MKLSNKTYDILKWVALVGIPAFATFFGVLGNTFNWENTQAWLTVIVAFDVMLGTMLGISNINYKKDINNKIENLPEDIVEVFKEVMDDTKES